MLATDISGFHIEPTNICTLKCPGCARTQFIKQWPQHWKNYSLDIEQIMNFLDIDLSEKLIRFCGIYGDPIYHPDFINFVRRFKERGANIKITTNGSYKSNTWWSELVELLSDQDQITFSIDGLPENFTQYRNNADWASIKIGIDIAAAATVKTEWKYIPFSFNQTDIELARELSTNLGIDKFTVSLSDRFDNSTNHLKPNLNLLGNRYLSQTTWKINNTNTIDPKCSDNREHYISADGYYSPCCYIADNRFYYKSQFGKHKKDYTIFNQTLSQILNNSKVVEFYRTLEAQPSCQFNCPG
jgi:MoaA/NifB/PqqE/SkfB family radical SAM enzyme